MKRTLAMILAAILTLSLAMCGAAAAGEWADYMCAEEQFSTKIPVNGNSGYEEGAGLVIYTDVPGYIPYIILHRRTGDMKFKNPANYLNNTYREHLENKYGKNSRGMNPASIWEIGGKELIGARYMYTISGYSIIQLQLIDIRDAGDVEYTVKFIEGEDEATMAALNEAVRNYRETDVAQESAMEPDNAEQAFEDALAALLTGDQQEEAAEDEYEDITKTEPEEEPEEEPEPEPAAEQSFEDVLAALLMGDQQEEDEPEDEYQDIIKTDPEDEIAPEEPENEPEHVADQSFEDMLMALLMGDQEEESDEDGYQDIVRTEAEAEPEPEPEAEPDSEGISLEDILAGLLQSEEEEKAVEAEYEEIVKNEQEETQAAAAAPAGLDETPSFLIPSEFVARFNSLMEAMADRYADYLGEDNVKILKEEFTITQEDIQGVFAYYDNNDWSLEAGFLYASEDEMDYTLPALTVNFSIRKDTPEIAAYLAAYGLQMMIGYEYQDEVSLDELSTWFDSANESGYEFSLPGGYTLTTADMGDYFTYAILTADNPYLQTQE